MFNLLSPYYLVTIAVCSKADGKLISILTISLKSRNIVLRTFTAIRTCERHNPKILVSVLNKERINKQQYEYFNTTRGQY